MKKQINIDNKSLTFSFAEADIDTIILPIDTLTDEILGRATLHGLSQKIGDSAASHKNEYDRHDAIVDCIAQLKEGKWNRKAGGGTSLLLEALCRLYHNKEQSDITDFLNEKSDKEKLALSKNGKIALIIAEIRAERSGDTGTDLIDELEKL